MSKKINQQFACSKMMLPEHRGSLQQHAARSRQEEECSRPALDEQEQERLQRIFEQALYSYKTLRVTVLGAAGRQTFSGRPVKCDPNTGTIFFGAGSGCPRAIRTADILHLAEADPP